MFIASFIMCIVAALFIINMCVRQSSYQSSYQHILVILNLIKCIHSSSATGSIAAQVR